MARAERIDYPGAWDHVMNGAARQEPIFAEGDHAGSFIAALAKAVDRFQIEVHAHGCG